MQRASFEDRKVRLLAEQKARKIKPSFEIRGGKAVGRPVEEVLAELRERYP